MEILSLIVLIIYAIIGGASTLYLLLAMPAFIIWKVYRKVKFGYRLTD